MKLSIEKEKKYNIAISPGLGLPHCRQTLYPLSHQGNLGI